MSNVICKKCGAEAISKCPICRSVFPENQIEAMLSWVLKFKTRESGNGVWLEVSYCMNDNETEAEAFERLARTLQAMLDETSHYPTPKQYACVHSWTMKEGEKSTIDCGHF